MLDDYLVIKLYEVESEMRLLLSKKENQFLSRRIRTFEFLCQLFNHFT